MVLRYVDVPRFHSCISIAHRACLAIRTVVARLSDRPICATTGRRVTNQLTARVTCIEGACLAAMGFIEVAGDGALEKDLDKWEEDG